MKQTNVPDGWKEVKLGDIAEITSGSTPSRDKPEYWGGDIPWVKTTQIQNCHISKNSIDEYITKKGFENSSLKIIPKGTILMAMYGQGKTRGQIGILDVDATTNQACAAIQNNKNTDTNFLYQLLLNNYDDIRKLSNTGGQQNLSGEIIRTINIIMPPLAEQKAIAEMLSVWDNMVEKMELLIAKKEEVFKFVQQQLITLPSEKENWTKVKIKDVIKLITPPYKIEKDEYQLNGKYPIIDQSKADIDGWTDNAEYVVNEGMPLVIFGDHTCKVKIVDVPFAQGADGIKIMSISPLLNPFYFYHYLLANPIAAEGYMRHFSILTDKDLFYPSYERQKEIAEILNCYQNEINIMEELIGQYKLQKQGLMQKLLTGQWRIK